MDWIVVETGLGGTHDATNLIHSPECCVLTSIAHDHCNVLGNSLSDIARNKAGIIKKGARVLSSMVLPEIEQAVSTSGAKWGEFQGLGTIVYDEDSLRLCFPDFELLIDNPSMFLRAPYVGSNMLLAAQVCLSLGLTPEITKAGIAATYWPGRMELLLTDFGQPLLIDAAHNSAGIDALFAALHSVHKCNPFRKLVFLFGARDRDGWQNSLASLHKGIESFNRLPISTEVFGVSWGDDLALDPRNQLELKALSIEDLNKCYSDYGEETFFVGLGSVHFIAKLREGQLTEDGKGTKGITV